MKIRITLAGLVAGLAVFPTWAQLQTDYIQTNASEQVDEYLLDLYKHFHTHPELSFYEKETSARVAQELTKAGCDEVMTDIGGYGVLGIMRNGKGKTVMVRADMDALPVQEATGLDYASTVTTEDDQGNTVYTMHACGHDVHMTSLIGTARMLGSTRNKWKGTVIFLGQPAEERGGGADAMLKDGLLEKIPLPDYALALHTSASLPAGHVGYVSGYAMANVNSVDIHIKGQGGHGAYPHTTKDPVVLAAKIILSLQTIVSREVSPLDPAVVTVGSIHGGTKHNIIGNDVHLQLTLRSYTEEVRVALIEKIKRICNGEAMASGIPEEMWPEVTVFEGTPSLYNDPVLTEKAIAAVGKVLQTENIHALSPVMGGEDFSRYGMTQEDIPIFLFWLGGVPQEKYDMAQAGEINLPSLHSALFYPDPEPTLTTGVQSMVSIVNSLLLEK
ncbi:MAG: amidohydrolase [Bacteroidota bacterium]